MDWACKTQRDLDALAPATFEGQEAVRLLIAVQTQWRVGMGGVEGLIYESLERAARWLDPPVDLRGATFDFVRIFEMERLVIQREEQEKEEAKRKAEEARRSPKVW